MEETLPDTHALAGGGQIAEPFEGENLFAYLLRTTGSVARADVARWLGAANQFKEGDAAIGVAAPDEATRARARRLLRATVVDDFNNSVLFAAPLLDDTLSALLIANLDPVLMASGETYTFGALVRDLLDDDAGTITNRAQHLPSEAIACVVKLLTNDELVNVSAKLSYSLPGGRIGAAGQLGARLQPNSPTDHPDDIRWQVFCGWSYGVGDVLLGTNPVSSDVESVARIEHTLKDVIETFGLSAVLPHCVLAHIDLQAAVERRDPGSTALWFQSVAGSDAANQTFDVTVAKMVQHAESRTGPFALYFETGQGADFTNGHGHGVDMLIHESRKYGFVRALTKVVDGARRAGSGAKAREVTRPWVIVNDVAGFIGPEVFRTKEQLVRCCLEDLVMGKLHGLTIGLDVCATLHMDISLDDLDWCLEQIMPACPAYLMALPTKIDPMLGYLTTGFQDHVRLREQFSRKVNPPMQAFFEELGVLDADGNAGPHFGDPMHVYIAYQRRRGDTRDEALLRANGAQQMAEVRARGVFIAEGHGERTGDLAPALDLQTRHIYDDARLAFWATLPDDFVATIPGAVALESCSRTREEYILHPTTGEKLSERSHHVVDAFRGVRGESYDLQIVVSDGLNALAIMEPAQLAPFLDGLRSGLVGSGWRVAPETMVVHSGRVRAGYRIGEVLFAGRRERCGIVHVVGERPGTGHHTLSAYVTVAGGVSWSVPDRVDHDTTRVIAGMATTALDPTMGAGQVVRLLAGLV